MYVHIFMKIYLLLYIFVIFHFDLECGKDSAKDKVGSCWNLSLNTCFRRLFLLFFQQINTKNFWKIPPENKLTLYKTQEDLRHQYIYTLSIMKIEFANTCNQTFPHIQKISVRNEIRVVSK